MPNSLNQIPNLPQGFSDDFLERFWSKVQITEECHLWIGGKTRAGYGLIQMGHRPNSQAIYSHRAAWIMKYGNIPHGLQVHHHCDNPPCVRWEHLWLGTKADNIADCVSKGRQAKGEKSGHSKLTWSQVEMIRKLYEDGGILQRELGEQFGVHRVNIGVIVRNEGWKQP